MREGDSGQSLRRIREDAEAPSRSRQGPYRRAGPGIRTKVDGSPVLGKALECGAPVSDPLRGPAVELLGGRAPILWQRLDVERCDRDVAPGCVGEEVAP